MEILLVNLDPEGDPLRIDDGEDEITDRHPLPHERLRGHRRSRPSAVLLPTVVDDPRPRGLEGDPGPILLELAHLPQRFQAVAFGFLERQPLLLEGQSRGGPRLLERELGLLGRTLERRFLPRDLERQRRFSVDARPPEVELPRLDLKPRPLEDHFLGFLGQVLVLVHPLELAELLAGILQLLLGGLEAEAGRILGERSADGEKAGEILGGGQRVALRIGQLQRLERLSYRQIAAGDLERLLTDGEVEVEIGDRPVELFGVELDERVAGVDACTVRHDPHDLQRQRPLLGLVLHHGGIDGIEIPLCLEDDLKSPLLGRHGVDRRRVGGFLGGEG